MKVYLIRHGKTRQNELGILQGAGIDSDLSEIGRSQARDHKLHPKLLKPVLPTEDVIVFSSPLKRALQTSQIATTGEIQINADLLERDYGPLEGKNYAENKRQAKEAGVEKPEDLPGIESLESVNSRIFCFLNELEKSVGKFEHAIVVTHSGLVGKIIRLLANQKGAMLADNIKDYNLDFIHCNNTSITRIDAQMENERVQYTIQSIADDKHLE